MSDGFGGKIVKRIKIIVSGLFVFGLASCSLFSSGDQIDDTAAPIFAPNPDVNYNIKDVRVAVPETLTVSEANVYYPIADIVWRGDAYGDRHNQVETLVDEAMTRGLKTLDGARAIYVDIEIKRFHSLTERAHYTVGGVHSIKFLMSLKDAKTGAVILPPRLVNADFQAFGGTRAVAAEHSGQTPKVRIMSHLAGVIQQEVITQNTINAVAQLR